MYEKQNIFVNVYKRNKIKIQITQKILLHKEGKIELHIKLSINLGYIRKNQIQNGLTSQEKIEDKIEEQKCH